MTAQCVNLLLLPAEGRCWVLVEEKPPISDLPAVEGAYKAKMQTSLGESLLDLGLVHLSEVHAVVPDGKGGARRSAYYPVRVQFIDEVPR